MIGWISAGISSMVAVWAIASYLAEIRRSVEAERELMELKFQLMLGKGIK